MRAKCSAQLIFLAFIILTMPGEAYKLRSSTGKKTCGYLLIHYALLNRKFTELANYVFKT